jgi:hypothetical protein
MKRREMTIEAGYKMTGEAYKMTDAERIGASKKRQTALKEQDASEKG